MMGKVYTIERGSSVRGVVLGIVGGGVTFSFFNLDSISDYETCHETCHFSYVYNSRGSLESHTQF